MSQKKNFTKRDLIKKYKEKFGKLICIKCGPEIEYNIRQLVEDHINNNRKDNSENNKQFLCRKHNYEKNPPFLYKLKGDTLNSVRERGWVRLQQKAQFAEMEKNMVSKPIFIKWFYSEMIQLNRMLLSDVIDSGSFISGVGPDTIYKRYLKPLCSRLAYCEIVDIELDEIKGPIRYVQWRLKGRENFLKSHYKELIKKFGK